MRDGGSGWLVVEGAVDDVDAAGDAGTAGVTGAAAGMAIGASGGAAGMAAAGALDCVADVGGGAREGAGWRRRSRSCCNRRAVDMRLYSSATWMGVVPLGLSTLGSRPMESSQSTTSSCEETWVGENRSIRS